MAYSQAHICHCLSRLPELRKDSAVIIASDRRRNGREFVDGILSLARGLLESGLLQRNEVVAIAAFNSDWYVEWMLAVTYVGGIIAPFNYRWSLEEAVSAMEDVKPVILVVDERCSSWAVPLMNNANVPSFRLCALIGGITASSLSMNGNVRTMDSIRKPLRGEHMEPICSTYGVALICFTSGTTGQPKGVAISHKALVIQSLAKIALVGYGEEDVYLHTTPLCHIGTISSCLAMLMVGSCHVFLPKFDAKLAFSAVEQHHVTSLICVPTVIADLIFFTRKTHRWNGETVNKILNGGGSLSAELVNGAINIFPNAKITSAYGMTETCSSLTFMLIYDPASQKLGRDHSIFERHNSKAFQFQGICVGKPAPHIELKISFDPASSASPLAGSILTRGLHVMTGYWHQSAITFDPGDEWFDTGDVGWFDSHGNLWLFGRTKDRIKSGGENIYPEEVETVLRQHPGVAAVVVIGIPDSRLAEKVVACVSIREEWKWVTDTTSNSSAINVLSGKLLQNYCRQKKLTGFKIPKAFVPWTKKPFPLTATGKVRREDVKKEVLMLYMRILSCSL